MYFIMSEKIVGWCDGIITKSFYLLFFLVPLILTPYNYELFEYNKMMTTYVLTTFIMTAWVIKMILKKEIKIARTPLDLPLLLFLFSQIISTFFSIDPHVSLFGYYSRFNGGLFSTISYILLYCAFVTNFPKEKIKTLLKTALLSGFLVSIYGILEHFGIDKDIWVQDVQNRVFSTLGQPNWLAAYIAVLIPITIGLYLKSKIPASPAGRQNPNYKSSPNAQSSKHNGFFSYFRILDLGFWILASLFYVTLLYTKSRSGFLAVWISLIIFSVLNNFLRDTQKSASNILNTFAAAIQQSISMRLIGIFILTFLLISFLTGSPYPQLNRFTWQELSKSNRQTTNSELQIPQSYGSSVIDAGITESGVIRRIVWKGALDIFRSFPLFGTGVETFAFSYYRFRPVAHNMTSEWDFLYNKAHNEFLNFAANTGMIGLGSYLFIIITFLIWFIKISKSEFLISNQIPDPKSQLVQLEIGSLRSLLIALVAGWLSILVTNFFGFSVVIVALFFFLIPAISFVLSDNFSSYSYSFTRLNKIMQPDIRVLRHSQPATNGWRLITIPQYTLCAFVLIGSFWVLSTIARFWIADVFFASGYHATRTSNYAQAYQSIRRAILLNQNEPLYYDELSYPAAQLAVTFFDDGQSTISAQLTNEAILASNNAVSTSPQNVNFWKTRTRVFYTLYPLDEKHLDKAKEALEYSQKLSPTDPKILYNLALIYDKYDQKDEAIKLLQKASLLKADYRDAYFALGLFYSRDKNIAKAKEAFNYILTKINPNDEDAKKQLEELK